MEEAGIISTLEDCNKSPASYIKINTRLYHTALFKKNLYFFIALCYRSMIE